MLPATRSAPAFHDGEQYNTPPPPVNANTLRFIASGATVIETVFSYPELGRLLYEAVLNRDSPVIRGTFFLLTVCVIGTSVRADLLYPLIDPRVRHGR